MKFKTTKKAVMRGYPTILSVGYCDVCTLFRDREPVAYTCGVYGWNADIYDVCDGAVAVVTGYRPFGVSVPYEVVRKYECKARNIHNKYAWKDYDAEKRELDSLILEFVNESIEVTK